MECEALHSLSEHTFRLHSLCRLCGERVKRKVKDRLVKTPKLCAKYAENILFCFDVDVQEDSEHKFPRRMCQKCYRRLINSTSRPNLSSQPLEDAARIAHKASFIWSDYDPSATITECTVCSHFHTTSKGGRPQNVNTKVKKRKLSDGASDISFLPIDTSASITVKSGTVPSVSQSACIPHLAMATLATTLCVTVPFPNGAQITMDKSGTGAVPKHSEVCIVVSLHHVASRHSPSPAWHTLSCG